jgi:hypothetical protein
MKSIRAPLAGLLAAGLATALFAVEGAAGGVRWTAPARWTVSAPRPMRAATYTIPPAPGGEAGECGVFYFGKGKGGSVDENLSRWEQQFESAAKPKRSQRTVHGLKVTVLDLSGTYLAPGGPMMQSQGKKPGWRLLGAIVDAPDGLVFFKCVGPEAAIKAAEKDFDSLIASVAPATVKA